MKLGSNNVDRLYNESKSDVVVVHVDEGILFMCNVISHPTTDL